MILGSVSLPIGKLIYYWIYETGTIYWLPDKMFFRSNFKHIDNWLKNIWYLKTRGFFGG